MHKWSVVALICSMLLVAVVFADQEPEAGRAGPDLLYTPESGSSMAYQMRMDLLDVFLQDNPMGMTGEVAAKVRVEFAQSPEQAQATKATLTLTDMQAQMFGEERSAPGPQIVTLTVDEHARVQAHEIIQRIPPGHLSSGADALTALAAFSMLPLLPLEVPAPDQTWESQLLISLPGGGQIRFTMRSRLVSSTAEEIIIESTGQGTLPEVQTFNPMMPGEQMTVATAQVTVAKLTHTCDPQTLVVRQAEGAGSIKFDGVTADYTLPLTVKMKFKLTPPAK